MTSPAELPTVSIEGTSWRLFLSRPRQDLPATEEHLTALLDALSPEQRERVLGPYASSGLVRAYVAIGEMLRDAPWSDDGQAALQLAQQRIAEIGGLEP